MGSAVEESQATTPPAVTTQPPGTSGPTGAAATEPPPGFAARGRLRRRVRFLRKARELAYRDLGGLVFNLHRFGQRNDELVLGKLTTLGQIDTELRALESSLGEHQPVTVLREAGLTACPRCAAIHSSEDRFCPNCGLPMSRHVDLPIAGPPAPPGGTVSPGAASQRADGQRASGAPAPPLAPTPASPPPPGTPPATSVLPAPLPPVSRPESAPGSQADAHSAPPPPAPPGAASPQPPRRTADDEPTQVVRPPSGSA
jgi:zinc-ribbon domain